MDEELEHIDLIDKYINEELTIDERSKFDSLMAKSPDFQQEVKLYEKLYLDIEKKGDEELKARLNVYYDDYQKEQVPNKNRGLQRFLILATSLAACLVLGFFLVTNRSNTPDSVLGNDSESEKTNSDTVDIIKPIDESDDNFAKENERLELNDSNGVPGEPKYVPQMALGGLQSVPASAIKSVEYPQALYYTFDGKMLILFGDPLISPLQIRILKANDQYLLQLKGESFKISNSLTRVPLTLDKGVYKGGETLGEEVSVQVSDIRAVASLYDGLVVKVTGNESVNPTYIFEEQGGKAQLVINGAFDPNRLEIIRVRQDVGTSIFLLSGSKLYLLNKEAEGQQELEPISVLSNNTTRLFREREPLKVKVNKVK